MGDGFGGAGGVGVVGNWKRPEGRFGFWFRIAAAWTSQSGSMSLVNNWTSTFGPKFD